MAHLQRVWLLEAGNDAPLGVDRVEDSANRAVLPARVPPLQDDEQRALRFRIHSALKLPQPIEQDLCFLLELIPARNALRRARVAITEAKWRTARDRTKLHGCARPREGDGENR